MSKNNDSGIGKFLAGAGLGVALGILFAPKSGEETRKDLKEKMNELIDKARSLDIDEVKHTIEVKVKEIKEDLKSLDRETVATKIKDGTEKIKIKVDELVDYAKKNGNAALEKAAKEMRESTIKTLDSISAKLKEKDNEDKKKLKATK